MKHNMEQNRRMKGGFLLFTRVNDTTNGTLVAHLQCRGRWDYKKGRQNTWPGVCRVTVEGNQRGIETPLATAWRKMKTELLADSNPFAWGAYIDSDLEENVVYADKAKTTYGLLVSEGVMAPVGLQSSSGGLVQVSADDLKRLIIARPEWRTNLHPCAYADIVTFAEVIKALEKGFKLFKDRS
jgi:hypothetical protein